MRAGADGDRDGQHLGYLLLAMTGTQRRKIYAIL
jgi:hypothetical protein